jgi:hypothetical protein
MKNEVLMDQPSPLLKTNKNVTEMVMDQLIPQNQTPDYL